MAIICTTSSSSSPSEKYQEPKQDTPPLIFNPSLLNLQSQIPNQFIWPDEEKPSINIPELNVPFIDLSSQDSSLEEASRVIAEACTKHGFFLVVNHGVNESLITEAHSLMERFFDMPLTEKQKAQRKPGESCGYASSFTGRFSTKLPWKETLSLEFSNESIGSRTVQDYMSETLGQEFEHFGKVFQDYCEAMNSLALKIMELLGLSLGLKQHYFREFFAENESIMRLNHYPPCQKPDLTLGTGPHCDPSSLTILHQDQVNGLQVFVDNQWQSIQPNPKAFVVNIGDTFMALSNGMFKSCLHRAVVNRDSSRRSMAFFLCPKRDKVVKPPSEILEKMRTRKYPDFTWSMFLEFTQKHYRADVNTLDSFSNWVIATKNAI